MRGVSYIFRITLSVVQEYANLIKRVQGSWHVKRYVVLLSLVLFVCLLTGYGNKVDKPTFILAMDQNISAVQMLDAEAVLLVNELLWIMPFVEDTASYRAKVAAYQERFDEIVLAAQKNLRS